jgi:uncharacterized repeat protein (TIGR01451 family)
MKIILLLFTSLYSLFTFAQTDPIINIPDANFKAKLLEASPNNLIASTETPLYDETNGTWSVSTYHKIDTNNDGQIQETEALNIKYLNINSSNISNLIGIEMFTNLHFLRCIFNPLTSLNVSSLINLKHLNCSNNQLTNLNVLGLTNLQILDCSYNQIPNINLLSLTSLTDLDVSDNVLLNLNLTNLTNLKKLDCSFNFLFNLIVSTLSNLKYLDCSNNGNDIINLNLSGLINLEFLYCVSCGLQILNVSNCYNLKTLACYGNQLISLNVSNLASLEYLDCNYNQLSKLFIKNNYSDLLNYNFSNNPNLQYICCSDNQLLQVQEKVTQYGYTNCHVNTYCSFTPGGNYNTISGQIKYDANQNGCDVNDEPLINRNILFSQDTNNGIVTTNNQGNYNAYVGSGTHNITPQIENPSLFISTPPTAQVTFANSNNNTQTQNFCITPNPNNITCSYESVIMPISPVRPGFDTDFKIIYRNLGNVVLTGEVVLPYNANTMSYISATPAPTTISNGLLKWSFSQFNPLQNRQITLKFNINPPTHPTFPVNGGDLVCFDPYMSITNNCGVVYQPFFDETCFEVVNSYDPNDKTCLQGNTPKPEYIGEYVHYKIRFENTGTYFAQNVVVRDDIDLTKFDINSLVVLDASHNMLVTRIKDNRVEFIFENIQLPFPPSEARHGYILFKIKLKSNLVVGNTFSNQANIYFDYNFPIITNNEVSTLTALGTPAFDFSEFITLFPNPANSILNINTKQGINLKSIEIFNMLGQLVMAIPNQVNETNIDISHLQSGQYMVKVNTDKGVIHSKFVKE